jgi:hypothetical protein
MDSRQEFAAWARKIELDQPISANTAAALQNIESRRLKLLVIHDAGPGVPLLWCCPLDIIPFPF